MLVGGTTGRSAGDRFRAFGAKHLAIGIALVPALLITGLLLGVAYLSIRSETGSQLAEGSFTLGHYITLYGNEFAVTAFFNTLRFTAHSSFWALFFGVSVAWLVARTDVGFRNLSFGLATVGVLIPNFFHAMAWIYLSHPRIGTINHWISNLPGNPEFRIDVMTMAGMGWVQGLSMVSVTFVLLAPSFSNMDAALEEAAQVHGANFQRTLRKITLPLSRAALVAAFLYVAAMGLSTLDIPLLIGVATNTFVFSSYLWLQTSSPESAAQYGPGASFATFMILIALFLSWRYIRVLAKARQFEVITGKSFKPKTIQLGRWRGPARVWLIGTMVLANIVPVIVLLWVSFLPFLQPIGLDAIGNLSLDNYRNMPFDLVRRGLLNTIYLAVLAPTIAVGLSLLFSWIVLRTRYRMRRAFDFVAFLPHAVPSVVFAFAAYLIVLRYYLPGFDLYGTRNIILILYVITMLSFGTRITNAALIQVHTELEESARLSGANSFVLMRKILLPLLKPSLVLAWIWLCMSSLRELTIAVMMLSRTNMTLPVVIYQNWSRGAQPMAAAITVVMMGIMLPLVILYFKKYGQNLWSSGDASGAPPPDEAASADDEDVRAAEAELAVVPTPKL